MIWRNVAGVNGCAGTGPPFPKFFQVNRDGEPKGILVVSFA
jgi:hypothetical protein